MKNWGGTKSFSNRFFRLSCLTLVFLFLCQLSVTPARAISPEQSADVNATAGVAQVASADSSDLAWNKCTGALVDSQWVLTARHCVRNAMGYTYVNLGPISKINWEFDVDRVVNNDFYDVSLLHLNKPSEVPPMPVAPLDLAPGQTATAYGWGGSNRLTEAVLRIVGMQDSYLLARPDPGTVSVVGDSGGPLIMDGKIYAVLSAAQVIPEGLAMAEDFKYVPSSAFITWMNEIIASSVRPVPVGPGANPEARPGSVSNQAQNIPLTSSLPGRIWGPERIATALAASATGWPAGSENVVVATGLKAPDALSGSSLAGALGAPLLLSVGTPIEPQVVNAIKSLGARSIYLIGGQVKFSENDLSSLSSLGIQVINIKGSDRYETALGVADWTRAILKSSGRNFKTVFLADGSNFADALGAGAAAGALGGIILLTKASQLEGKTRNYLNSVLDIVPMVYAVGGPAARALRSSGLAGKGQSAWQDIVGKDRYETATTLAKIAMPNARGAILASGVSFPDGLSGGALALQLGFSLVLTENFRLNPSTAAYFNDSANRAFTRVIGGPRAVSDAAGMSALYG